MRKLLIIVAALALTGAACQSSEDSPFCAEVSCEEAGS